MRKTVLGLALASSALATPALARDDAWYLELDAGATIAENINVRTNPGGVLAAVVDTDVGYDFGGIVGYDFGAFRLEAEGAYKRVSVKDIPGHVDALSFMVNGLVDFGPDDGLQGFVGGGVGVARVGANIPVAVNDSDSGFAWQLLAGIRYPLSERVDLGLKYRFFNVDNVDLV
ncbi:MAG: outer membrane protein, partial [Novosphingobium sp.]